MSAGHPHSSAHYGNKDAIRAVVVSAILLFVVSAVYDRLHPLEFHKSISDGNVAAGVVLGSIIIALGIIISALVRA